MIYCYVGTNMNDLLENTKLILNCNITTVGLAYGQLCCRIESDFKFCLKEVIMYILFLVFVSILIGISISFLIVHLHLSC